MELVGLIGMRHQALSMESPTETVPLWQWVVLEPSLPLLMELHGLLGLLVYQELLMESPTQMEPSWWWVIQEPSSPLLMEPLGLLGLLGRQTLSMEPLPAEAH